MAKVVMLSSVHNALDNRIFYREAQSLARSGYTVEVIAVHDCHEKKDGINIVGLPRLSRKKRPLIWLKLLRSAWRSDADVYHIHDMELLLLLPWLKWLAGKRLVYDVHESNEQFVLIKEYIPSFLRRFLSRAIHILEQGLARQCHGLIFADDQISIAFQSLELPKATLLNFPESGFIKKAVAASQVPEKREPTVIHLGAHTSARGLDIMLKAFPIVLSHFPDAHLLLVGPFWPAALEREVRNEISARHLQNQIMVSGPVPFAEVGSYLSKASIGWVPLQPVAKYQKNIPTKLFEYMAYGLAPVCSNLEPVRPFIKNSKSGLLVEPSDPAAHASAIVKLLAQPELARKMGLEGQKLVETSYNWDQMETRLLSLYAELLGKAHQETLPL